MQFDLTDLRLFRHVVEAGSITHGAERAHLALAAASTRIRNMEKSLGAPLLVRSRQGVTPTAAGRTLLQHARDAPGPGRAAARGPRRLCGRARRPDPDPLQHQCADRVPARGAGRVPRRRIRRSASTSRSGSSDEIVGLIAEGVGDIGIVAGTVDTGRLETYPVPQRPLRPRGAARPSARRQRPSIAFAEVLDHDFVGLDRASALQRFLADKASRIGARSACGCSCAASMRSAAWWKRASASASCRRPPPAAPPAPPPSPPSPSRIPGPRATSPSASATLQDLPPSARQLVEHLRQASL